MSGTYWLNGKETMGSIGVYGEKIDKKVSVDPFMVEHVVLDVYLNCDVDGGVLRIKKVGNKGDDVEMQMSNINSCPDGKKDGWIPHFMFEYQRHNEIKLMMAAVPLSWYGIDADIDWQ